MFTLQRFISNTVISWPILAVLSMQMDLLPDNHTAYRFLRKPEEINNTIVFLLRIEEKPYMPQNLV